MFWSAARRSAAFAGRIKAPKDGGAAARVVGAHRPSESAAPAPRTPRRFATAEVMEMWQNPTSHLHCIHGDYMIGVKGHAVATLDGVVLAWFIIEHSVIAALLIINLFDNHPHPFAFIVLPGRTF